MANKRPIIALLLCCIILPLTGTFNANAQSPSGWTYVGFSGEGHCVIQTIDGGYIVAGDVQTIKGQGSTSYLLAKFNTSGGLEWSKNYGDGTGKFGQGYAVIQTSDGGFAFAGNGVAFNFAKTDSQGNLQWNCSLQRPSSQVFCGQSLLQTSDGGYIVIGYTDASPSDWVVKTDQYGIVEWNKTCGIGVEGAFSKTGDHYTLTSSMLSIVPASDNGYLLSGSSGLAKINANGDVLWINRDLSGIAISAGNDGYLILNSSRTVGYLTKIDAYGNVTCSRAYATLKDKSGVAFRQGTLANDGGYIICGLAGRQEQIFYDNLPMVTYDYAHVTKVDAKGDVQWSTFYAATGPPMPSMGKYPNSIIVASDGGIVFTGRTQVKVWLVKITDKTTPNQTPLSTSSPIDNSTINTSKTEAVPLAAQLELSQTTALAATSALIVLAIVGLLLYHKKTKRKL